MFKKILFLVMMVIITTSCDNTPRNIKEKLFLIMMQQLHIIEIVEQVFVLQK